MSAYFSTLAKICQKVKLKAENVVILGDLISIARIFFKKIPSL